jgi:hypothetical protein
MSYVLSNANRWYCGLETTYGAVSSITSDNRIPAIKMTARQQLERATRHDKTGGRTYAGTPPGGRKKTEFTLSTYLTSWTNAQNLPAYGPLFYAAMGAPPLIHAGETVASVSGPNITFSAPHGLVVNQAISSGSEIRFVSNVIDPSTVTPNAPFSTAPPAGSTFSPTVTFLPGDTQPSCSLFDYWSPSTALQRVICGAGVDTFSLEVNGDYQEFHFAGMAQDIIDSASFTSGLGQLASFPSEPALGVYNCPIVPGNLGQIWMGVEPNSYATLTSAELRLKNNLEARANEFGSQVPQFLSPGTRRVAFDFTLFEQDNQATMELYQAARQQSTIPVMLQVGQSTGQLFGAYMKSVLPEVPEIDDSQQMVQWRVSGSRAQGSHNDELVIAFA